MTVKYGYFLYFLLLSEEVSFQLNICSLFKISASVFVFELSGRLLSEADISDLKMCFSIWAKFILNVPFNVHVLMGWNAVPSGQWRASVRWRYCPEYTVHYNKYSISRSRCLNINGAPCVTGILCWLLREGVVPWWWAVGRGVIERAQPPGVPSGFLGLPLDHNRSAQRSSRITAKYFIKSIIQQLPWEAESKREEKMMVREREGEKEGNGKTNRAEEKRGEMRDWENVQESDREMKGECDWEGRERRK